MTRKRREESNTFSHIHTKKKYKEEIKKLRREAGLPEDDVEFLFELLQHSSYPLHILSMVLGYNPRDWTRTWDKIKELKEEKNVSIGRSQNFIFIKDPSHPAYFIQTMGKLVRHGTKLELTPPISTPLTTEKEVEERQRNKANKALTQRGGSKEERKLRSAALLRLVLDRTSLDQFTTGDVAVALTMSHSRSLYWLRDWRDRGWIDLEEGLQGSGLVSTGKVLKEFKTMYYRGEKFKIYYEVFVEKYPPMVPQTRQRTVQEERLKTELETLIEEAEITNKYVFTSSRVARILNTSRQTARIKLKKWSSDGFMEVDLSKGSRPVSYILSKSVNPGGTKKIRKR